VGPIHLEMSVRRLSETYSFGTVVDAGFGLTTLFTYLAESDMPFVYAGANQKDELPGEVKPLLEGAERDGRAIAPHWLDQIGVLSHPVSILP